MDNASDYGSELCDYLVDRVDLEVFSREETSENLVCMI